MDIAVLIDYRQIYQIRERKIIPSSKFDDLAAKLKNTAKVVKKKWNNFSPAQREELKNFAYSLLEPETGIHRIWYSIRAKLYILFLVATNQFKSFCDFIDALDYLVDTILDCIERNDPGYQAVLSDTLEELRLNHERIPEVKPEDTRAWLRSLSDKAFSEI